MPRISMRIRASHPHVHTCRASVRSFIAEVLKDAKADKPAKIIKFNDGAEVQFYVKPHARARKTLKHVHLSNENVKFLVPKAGASSSSSPTESAGSKEF